MEIALITDLHLNAPHENTNGVNVWKNFEATLAEIRALQPDHLVVNGDLCLQTGNALVYARIRQALDELHIPYSIIAGNHDDPALLAAAFGLQHALHGAALYYALQWGNWKALFLDSSAQFLSDEQLQWLENQLQNTKNQVVIFLHHPPFAVGVPFMDTHHALQHTTRLQNILSNHNNTIPVFCGHYHVEKTAVFQNIVVQITPSCYFQIDLFSLPFKIDHKNIAFRIIYLLENGWRTTVRYLKGNEL